MKRRATLLAALFLLLATTGRSQQLSKRITNKDVIDMTALGLSDDIIVSKIRSANPAGGTHQGSTSVQGVDALKNSRPPRSPTKSSR